MRSKLMRTFHDFVVGKFKLALDFHENAIIILSGKYGLSRWNDCIQEDSTGKGDSVCKINMVISNIFPFTWCL